MVEELFRFVIITPPDPATGPIVGVDEDSPFQRELRSAGADRSARARAVERFVAGKSFVTTPEDSDVGRRLVALDDVLSAAGSEFGAIIQRAVADAVGDTTVISSEQWKMLKGRLADTLVAHAYARGGAPGSAKKKAKVLRLMHVVERLATAPAPTDDELRALVRAPVRLPSLASTAVSPPAPQPPPSPRPGGGTTRPSRQELATAIGALARVPITHFATMRVNAPAGGLAVEVSSVKLGETSPSSALRLSTRGVSGLDPGVRRTLTALGIDPTSESVPQMQAEIRRALRADTEIFFPLLLVPGFIGVFLGGAASSPAVPTSVGTFRRLGSGKLRVVKQRLTRYEPMEVAHIENILPGEKKVRQHRRRRMTEDLLVETEESTAAEERELESTDRFELATEVAETVKEQFEVKGGLRLNAQLGPQVQLEVSAEAGYTSNRERSDKRSVEIGREVVQRAVAKLEEKRKTERTRRVLEEIIELNRHELTNPSATAPIRGVYQWVDKIYTAQTYDYGTREMYEFDIPEPGAYLLEALKARVKEVAGLEEPAAFDLTPDDIDEDTFELHAARLGATGAVEPPPLDWTVRTHAFTREAPGEEPEGDEPAPARALAAEANVPIGDGLEAVFALVTVVWHARGQVMCTVGPHIYDFSRFSGIQGGGIGTDDGVAMAGSVRVGIVATDPENVLATIHVLCRPTDRARNAWRLRTFEAIRQAHERKVKEYKEALAAQAVAAGVTLPERSAAESRAAIEVELRKTCIAIATRQNFDTFGAIASDAAGRPQLDFDRAEAQGAYARFFEQAFEWEALQYVLYPYFWGRKSKWEERVGLKAGSDPELAAFLKAGSARVVVPLREGFGEALEHFKRTGEIYGGDGVAMGDPDYIDIADEIRSQTDRDPENLPTVGSPWMVRVPTSLFRVADDSNLPEFE